MVFKKSLTILIRSLTSKERQIQHNGQRKGTYNDLQNITSKTKDRTTRSTQKTGSDLMCSGRVGSSCSICDTRRVTFNQQMLPS